jgi:hypothetical protein
MGGKDSLYRGMPVEQYRNKIGRNFNKQVENRIIARIMYLRTPRRFIEPTAMLAMHGACMWSCGCRMRKPRIESATMHRSDERKVPRARRYGSALHC